MWSSNKAWTSSAPGDVSSCPMCSFDATGKSWEILQVLLGPFSRKVPVFLYGRVPNLKCPATAKSSTLTQHPVDFHKRSRSCSWAPEKSEPLAPWLSTHSSSSGEPPGRALTEIRHHQAWLTRLAAWCSIFMPYLMYLWACILGTPNFCGWYWLMTILPQCGQLHVICRPSIHAASVQRC